jgi:hypothetical protein
MNLNVSVNRQHSQQLEGFTAGGNFTFRITLK